MELPRRVEALLFDLDGTIIHLPDQQDFFDRLLVRALQIHKADIPSREERLDLWHTGAEFEGTIRGWGVKNYQAFLETFDELDLEERKRLVAKGYIHPFPEAEEALRKLAGRGLRLGLVTNTPPEIACFELEAFNLRRYFQALVMLGTVEQHLCKPEPHGLLRCLRLLSTSPSRALMVGDSRSDIIAGRRAGVATILVHRSSQLPSRLQEAKPNLVISSLTELLNLV